MVDPGPMIQCQESRSRIKDQDQTFSSSLCPPPPLPSPNISRIVPRPGLMVLKTLAPERPLSFDCDPRHACATSRSSSFHWSQAGWHRSSQQRTGRPATHEHEQLSAFFHNQWCERPVCSPSESPRGGEGNMSMECGSSLPPSSLYPKSPRSEVEFCVEEDKLRLKLVSKPRKLWLTKWLSPKRGGWSN